MMSLFQKKILLDLHDTFANVPEKATQSTARNIARSLGNQFDILKRLQLEKQFGSRKRLLIGSNAEESSICVKVRIGWKAYFFSPTKEKK